jgi:hypothetical protein
MFVAGTSKHYLGLPYHVEVKMKFNRRLFLKAILGLPLLAGAKRASAKEKDTKLPKKRGHHLLLASRLFERYRIYPGQLAEVVLDELPPDTPRAVFMDPLDRYTRIPRRWENGNCYCYVPRYEIQEEDDHPYELAHRLHDRIEEDCRALLIAAGQFNTVAYGKLPEIHQKIRRDLGDDCLIFNRWIGPAPHFYRYTVGVKKAPENLQMFVFSEPELYAAYKLDNKIVLKSFAYIEMGLAVVNHKFISIGREPNELRSAKGLVPAIA